MQLAEMVVLAAAVETGRPPNETEFPFVFVEWTRAELWQRPDAAGPVETAGTAAEWVAGRRARGIQRLTLVIPGLNTPGTLPDRHAFGLAGPAGEQLVAPGIDEMWRVLSRVGDRGRADRRIWQLMLQGMAPPPGTFPRPPLPTPVPIARQRLGAALRELVAHATSAGLDAGEAVAAIAVADGTTDARRVQGNWLPDDWRTPEARHLIHSAFAANVFRGMGSWNDFGPPTPGHAAEHERVSQQLYVAMLDAVVAGVNS